jgi:hypothetical protein
VLADTWVAKYEAKAAKDSTFKQVWDTYWKGVKEWNDAYAEHKEDFEAAWKIEEQWAEDPVEVKGCADDLRKRLFGYIASKKAKTAEDKRALMFDMVGFPLAGALGRCEAAEKNLLTAYSMYYGLRAYRGSGQYTTPHSWRGPRWAAAWAVTEMIPTIESDKKREAFSLSSGLYGPPREPENYSWHKVGEWAGWKIPNGGTNNLESAEGEVGSVKPGKDAVTVVFKNAPVRVWDQDCKETNRIDHIDSGGQIVYRQNCKITGSHFEKQNQQAPLIVPKEYAEGIKAGSWVVYTAERDHKATFKYTGTPHKGFVHSVFANDKKDKLVAINGVK